LADWLFFGEMIFKICKMPSRGIRALEIQALSNLLRSSIEGLHALVADLGTLKSLQSAVAAEISRQDLRYLDYLIDRFTTRVGPLLRSDVVVDVLFDDDPASPRGIKLERFAFAGVASRAVLVSEGNVDFRIFHCLFGLYFDSEFSAETRLGGGSQTPGVFEREIESNRVVLAIVDSDKKHSSDSVSREARQVVKLAADASSDLVEALVLPVRELENLLPIEVYIEVLGAEVAQEVACIQSVAPAAYEFLDIKKGASAEAIGRGRQGLQDDWASWIENCSPDWAFNGLGEKIASRVAHHLETNAWSADTAAACKNSNSIKIVAQALGKFFRGAERVSTFYGRAN